MQTMETTFAEFFRNVSTNVFTRISTYYRGDL